MANTIDQNVQNALGGLLLQAIQYQTQLAQQAEEIESLKKNQKPKKEKT